MYVSTTHMQIRVFYDNFYDLQTFTNFGESRVIYNLATHS